MKGIIKKPFVSTACLPSASHNARAETPAYDVFFKTVIVIEARDVSRAGSLTAEKRRRINKNIEKKNTMGRKKPQINTDKRGKRKAKWEKNLPKPRRLRRGWVLGKFVGELW